MTNVNLNTFKPLSNENIAELEPLWEEHYNTKRQLNSSLEDEIQRQVKKIKLVGYAKNIIYPNDNVIQQTLDSHSNSLHKIETTLAAIEKTIINNQTIAKYNTVLESIANINLAISNLQNETTTNTKAIEVIRQTISTLQNETNANTQILNGLCKSVYYLRNENIRAKNKSISCVTPNSIPLFLVKENAGIGNFVGILNSYSEEINGANLGAIPTQPVDFVNGILDTIRDRNPLNNLQISFLVKFYNNQMGIENGDLVQTKTKKLCKFLGIDVTDSPPELQQQQQVQAQVQEQHNNNNNDDDNNNNQT